MNFNIIEIISKKNSYFDNICNLQINDEEQEVLPSCMDFIYIKYPGFGPKGKKIIRKKKNSNCKCKTDVFIKNLNNIKSKIPKYKKKKINFDDEFLHKNITNNKLLFEPKFPYNNKIENKWRKWKNNGKYLTDDGFIDYEYDSKNLSSCNLISYNNVAYYIISEEPDFFGNKYYINKNKNNYDLWEDDDIYNYCLRWKKWRSEIILDIN